MGIGIADGETRQLRAAINECKGLDRVDPWFGRWDCGLETEDSEECSATVGELSSCSDEVLDAFQELHETADCYDNPARGIMDDALSPQMRRGRG